MGERGWSLRQSLRRSSSSDCEPPQLDGIRDAYVVYAVDDSMEPRYHSGELVYVDPT